MSDIINCNSWWGLFNVIANFNNVIHVLKCIFCIHTGTLLIKWWPNYLQTKSLRQQKMKKSRNVKKKNLMFYPLQSKYLPHTICNFSPSAWFFLIYILPCSQQRYSELQEPNVDVGKCYDIWRWCTSPRDDRCIDVSIWF